jgi:hypothetical protein
MRALSTVSTRVPGSSESNSMLRRHRRTDRRGETDEQRHPVPTITRLESAPEAVGAERVLRRRRLVGTPGAVAGSIDSGLTRNGLSSATGRQHEDRRRHRLLVAPNRATAGTPDGGPGDRARAGGVSSVACHTSSTAGRGSRR